MFTGFASENTPAIQVWDFFRTFATTTAVRSVSLADDCAPIQVFRTGATATVGISVFLPSCYPEGKRLTIVNQRFGASLQRVNIRSSDVSGTGDSSVLYALGAGAMLELVYTKQAITQGTTNGAFQSGWVSLNTSSMSSAGAGGVALGLSCDAYAAESAALGGANNSASGLSSTVAGGNSNVSSGSYSAVVGGSNNTASNTYSTIVGSVSSTANSISSAVVGGSINQANANASVVVGGERGTARSIIGAFVTTASVVPITSAQGVNQTTTLILARQTTDATATVLASNTVAASTTNQVILPNNSAYTFQGTCIANVTGGGTTSGWKFEGVIKRGANAASTALVAAVTPTVIAQDAGAVTWVLAVTADTTNGGIAVTVTGAAATTIRWVAKIETTEVTF
jgi:hypothetical protein